MNNKTAYRQPHSTYHNFEPTPRPLYRPPLVPTLSIYRPRIEFRKNLDKNILNSLSELNQE